MIFTVYRCDGCGLEDRDPRDWGESADGEQDYCPACCEQIGNQEGQG